MNIAILGFGREGKSVLKFLKKSSAYRYSEITILDKKFNADYLKNLDRFDVIFRSPGVPFNLPEIQSAIKNGVKVSSATKLFFQQCPAPIIGITGTKGKSTTATLLYKILKNCAQKPWRKAHTNKKYSRHSHYNFASVYLAGNIGKPALEILPKLSKKSLVILELSSFQLQDIEQSPQTAVVLDIFPDHLDAHKNWQEYLKAKSIIATYQKHNNQIFYFSDNKNSRKIAKKSRGKKIAVACQDPSPIKNIFMAKIVARHFGCPENIIAKTIENFRGLKNRLELVRQIRNIKFYNDSAATNPEATAAAIRSFGAPIAHFIGIGGIGMSALARYFLSERWEISGSDLTGSQITDELKARGAIIRIGKHKSSNTPKNAKKIIYNQAISPDNPELRGFAQSYPEAIGELTKKYKTIAIAGSHGKSTTTALTSLILTEAGFDPTVIIGTKLKEFGESNFRKGKSRWLVLEADEWKASFLNYFPRLGAITNIDKEHLDFYKTFANVKKAFAKFKKQCGKIVVASKNKELAEEIKKIIKIPGKHNIANALTAYAIGKELKIPRKIILKAIAKYRGAWRRMEYRGKMPNTDCCVYDDYAHHPTEIKATLAAFKEKWPQRRLICVFQAHQAARLKLLFNDFGAAFKKADGVIILPTYEVAGREKNPNHNLSKKLARAIGATYIANPSKNLKPTLKSQITNYKLPITLIMMGAGDIVNYTNLLVPKTMSSGKNSQKTQNANRYNPIILIAGGKDKNLNYAPLAKAIKESGNVKQVILFGENKREIKNALSKIKNYKFKIYETENLRQTIIEARQTAKSLIARDQSANPIVLFSPASASFDMFKDYKERGKQFKTIVRSVKI